MADLASSLQRIRKIPGNLGAALVDVQTGLCLAQIGGRNFDLTRESDAYAKFVQLKEETVCRLNLNDKIEEIVVTSRSQYHMLYPIKVRILKVRPPDSLFFLVALCRNEAVLVKARSEIREIVTEFTI